MYLRSYGAVALSHHVPLLLGLQEGSGGFEMSRTKECCVGCNPERNYGFADQLHGAEGELLGTPCGVRPACSM